MNLIFYTGMLLSFFKDRRVIRSVEEMIKKMIEKKTTRLYTIVEDTNEYNRFKSLLDGSLKSVLDDKKFLKLYEKIALKLCLAKNR